MTSEKQVEANQQNAKLSTGPKNTSNSRINAIGYGLTGFSAFSEEQELKINDIYADLDGVFKPANIYEEFLISRMAIYIYRLQKSTHIEEDTFVNSYIDEMGKNAMTNPNGPDPVVSCRIDSPIELIMRYETTNENRLLRLAKYFQERRK